MEPELRTIAGFPRYKVSPDGNVWSDVSGKYLRLRPDTHGYMIVFLWNGPRKQIKRVHQLVLEAFVGPRQPGMVGCHCNGNPQDNRMENLRWDTQKANARDQIEHGTFVCGSKVGNSRLKEDDIRRIRELRSCGMTHAKIADLFGVCRASITTALLGRTWRHVV